jgi:Domain of unknown function (DUF4386)
VPPTHPATKHARPVKETEMTIRTDPPDQDYLGDAPQPAWRGLDVDWSTRRASLTAGIGTLLMIPLAVFGNFVAVQGLVRPGDAEATARDILASEGTFRLGIVSLFLVIVLDVVVAWALFRVFSPVSRAISMLAAWFRIVFAGVFLVAVAELVGVLHLLSNDSPLAVFDPRQLHSLALLRINAFTDIWDAGLVLFSVHLLLIGYLAYRSGFVPRIVGVLLLIAGLGYLTDSLGRVLFHSYSVTVGAFTFLGEVLLGLWLLFRARHIAASTSTRPPPTAPSTTTESPTPTPVTLPT